MESKPEIGIPDGVVGPNTWKHIKRWAEGHKTAVAWERGKKSETYKKWMGLLKAVKTNYSNNDHPILDQVNAMVDRVGPDNTNTLKTQDWNVDENQIHLIGIRRKEEVGKKKRLNDDMFVLLIDGKVFSRALETT